VLSDEIISNFLDLIIPRFYHPISSSIRHLTHGEGNAFITGGTPLKRFYLFHLFNAVVNSSLFMFSLEGENSVSGTPSKNV
jgi:hypothetical protein